jgi:hypothetical protein
MTGVILQPSYIPWRGYFHLIQRADVFVFYDDVQYDKQGWRNRNRIKGPNGPQWLTIPVFSKSAVSDARPIHDVRINWNTAWNRKHWETLRQVYGRSAHFERLAPVLEAFYERRDERLCDLTVDLTIALAAQLGISETRFVRSSELGISGTRTQRLVSILQAVGANRYISGPAARAYLTEDRFREAGIDLDYMTYDYREYEQPYPPFDPHVSVVDLMFTVGPDAPRYIWGGDPM